MRGIGGNRIARKYAVRRFFARNRRTVHRFQRSVRIVFPVLRHGRDVPFEVPFRIVAQRIRRKGILCKHRDLFIAEHRVVVGAGQFARLGRNARAGRHGNIQERLKRIAHRRKFVIERVIGKQRGNFRIAFMCLDVRSVFVGENVARTVRRSVDGRVLRYKDIFTPVVERKPVFVRRHAARLAVHAVRKAELDAIASNRPTPREPPFGHEPVFIVRIVVFDLAEYAAELHDLVPIHRDLIVEYAVYVPGFRPVRARRLVIVRILVIPVRQISVGQFVFRYRNDVDAFLLEPIDVIIDDDRIVFGRKRIQRRAFARFSAFAVITETIDRACPDVVQIHRLRRLGILVQRGKVL